MGPAFDSLDVEFSLKRLLHDTLPASSFGRMSVRSEADQFSKGAFELNGVSLEEALGALPNSPSSCSTGSGGDGV
jgi:hypothetical protein